MEFALSWKRSVLFGCFMVEMCPLIKDILAFMEENVTVMEELIYR
jgi:hypothetical protein